MRDALMANLVGLYDRLDELEREIDRRCQEDDISRLEATAREAIAHLERERDNICRQAKELAKKLINMDRSALGKV